MSFNQFYSLREGQLVKCVGSDEIYAVRKLGNYLYIDGRQLTIGIAHLYEII